MPSTSSRRIQAASTNIGNYERTQPDQNRVHSSIVGESRNVRLRAENRFSYTTRHDAFIGYVRRRLQRNYTVSQKNKTPKSWI